MELLTKLTEKINDTKAAIVYVLLPHIDLLRFKGYLQKNTSEDFIIITVKEAEFALEHKDGSWALFISSEISEIGDYKILIPE